MPRAVVATIKEGFPCKPDYNTDVMPDLTGKIIIVTGANTGIGKETSKVLLAHNAKVYMAARSKEKAEAAIKELKELTGNEGIFLQLDLSDLPSVRSAAEEFLSKETELHILFNNAGVFRPPINTMTAQGHDLQFGTNVLGHFFFTQLLLSALQEGAKSSPDHTARVVNTASSVAYQVVDIDYDLVKETPRRRKVSPLVLYGTSKFGNIIFSNELARRYGGQGIVSVSLNPGNLNSEMQRNVGKVERMVAKTILHPVALGALTQLWAGTSPEGAGFNGKYLIPWARMGKLPEGTDNLETAERLWTWCEDQVQGF